MKTLVGGLMVIDKKKPYKIAVDIIHEIMGY